MKQPIQFIAEQVAEEVLLISKKKGITFEEALMVYKFVWETS